MKHYWRVLEITSVPSKYLLMPLPWQLFNKKMLKIIKSAQSTKDRNSPGLREMIRSHIHWLYEKIPFLLLRHRLQITCWHSSSHGGRKPPLPGKSSVRDSQTSKPPNLCSRTGNTCSLHLEFYNDWFPVQRNWVWEKENFDLYPFTYRNHMVHAFE